MRIAAVSDIHFPMVGKRRLQQFAAACEQHEPDVLVLAGDLTAFSLADFGRVLRELCRVAEVRLAVAGNHDIWTHAGRQTLRRYTHGIPALCERFGFQLLDSGPVLVGDVGFVGCLGWYDYSLRQLEEPVAGVRISPARPSHRSNFSHLRVMKRREDLRWDQLTTEDYRGKALTWREDGRLRSLVWNDALYVNWHAPDESVVAGQVRHLQASASQLLGATRLVAITHTVPFVEAFQEPYSRVEWAFCRAYMGAAALGQALAADERVVLWLTGHVHYQVAVECKGTLVVNVAAAPEQRHAGPTLISLTGREIEVKRVRIGENGEQGHGL
jgi:predicted phosphodiesterase